LNHKKQNQLREEKMKKIIDDLNKKLQQEKEKTNYHSKNFEIQTKENLKSEEIKEIDCFKNEETNVMIGENKTSHSNQETDGIKELQNCLQRNEAYFEFLSNIKNTNLENDSEIQNEKQKKFDETVSHLDNMFKIKIENKEKPKLSRNEKKKKQKMMPKMKPKLNEIQEFLENVMPKIKEGDQRGLYENFADRYHSQVTEFMEELEAFVDEDLLNKIHALRDVLTFTKPQKFDVYGYEMVLLHFGGGSYCSQQIAELIGKLFGNSEQDKAFRELLREVTNIMVILFKKNISNNQKYTLYHMTIMDEKNDPRWEKLQFMFKNQDTFQLPENKYEYFLQKLGTIIYGARTAFDVC